MVATLCRPTAVTYATDGTCFIGCAGDGDGHGHTIRVLTTGGEVFTLAGIAGEPGYVDGTGRKLQRGVPAAGQATFHDPVGLGLTRDGYILFVADRGNHAIRRLLLQRGPHGRLRPDLGEGSVTVDTLMISGAPVPTRSSQTASSLADNDLEATGTWDIRATRTGSSFTGEPQCASNPAALLPPPPMRWLSRHALYMWCCAWLLVHGSPRGFRRREQSRFGGRQRQRRPPQQRRQRRR